MSATDTVLNLLPFKYVLHDQLILWMEKGIKTWAYIFISHISRFNYLFVESMPAMNILVICFYVKTMLKQKYNKDSYWKPETYLSYEFSFQNNLLCHVVYKD